ncbi:nucleotidyltransferase [Clostridium thermarum]|uniref:nucleotidyltransferase n=1 Tax=Clostridium thermarum TaxID=1716543 RepID=UPI0013D75B96|nr:nucleotidyltransferase [Clostridium thermarum]
MKVAAIICEYNPLHNGHLYQIDLTKKITGCDSLIAIMSGNFVQRGEPAIIDKWLRTKMALSNGVDLVMELPSIYALSSAEFFAEGAVSILNNLNVVNALCFGSECGEILPLLRIAEILYMEPEDYRAYLKTFLNEGRVYPAARSLALQKYITVNLKDSSAAYKNILMTSNNILGIEYCKSLIANNSSIKPYTITRIGSGYNDENISNGFSSATAIRKHLKNHGSMESIASQLPKNSFDIIMQLKKDNYDFTYPDSMFRYIKYKALTKRDTNIENLFDVSEGLHNRLYKYILESNSLEDLISKIKTKRYTYTRLCRILTQYFIGFEEFDQSTLLNSKCDYIRVLGFNRRGGEILNLIKKNSTMKIISKFPKNITNDILKLDLASTRAYSVINKNVRYNDDYLRSPIIFD